MGRVTAARASRAHHEHPVWGAPVVTCCCATGARDCSCGPVQAFAYIKTESFGAAVQDANSAIEQDPSFTKAYYRRASANFQLGKLDDALKVGSHAVSMPCRRQHVVLR